MILQSASNDFRCTCRATVYEYDNWEANISVSLLSKLSLDALTVSTNGRNDQSTFDEEIGYCDCLIEEPAWIITKIEN